MAIDAHRSNLWKILLPLLLLPALMTDAAAQVIDAVMVNGETVNLSNCRFVRGRIDIPDQVITSDFDSWAVVDFNDRIGTIVANWRFAGINSNSDTNSYVDIWDGDQSGTKLVDHSCFGSVYDTIRSGRLTIHAKGYAASCLGISLGLIWYSDSLASVCKYRLRSPSVGNIGAHTALLMWDSNSDSMYIEYGTGVHMITGNSKLLVGLDSNTEYTVTLNTWPDRGRECCKLKTTFTTINQSPPCCIDVTDLDSPFATCYVSSQPTPDTFFVPTPLDSVVAPINGRHTVMTDPTATDPNTCNQLHVVPPGHSTSLRLGDVYSEVFRGEGIAFQMIVDTMQYDIFMLKYAAVLQVPSHQLSMMPKFTFTIYDENMQPVDPTCSAASFIASPDLGWNDMGGLCWKDWTTIGIDLTPYHGRFLNIVFTTRDCGGGEHYGYAYIVTECFRKGITSPQCGGEAVSHLIAPEGFNYLWYIDDPEDTISTSPDVDISIGGVIYHCRISYVENPACSMTLSVYSGARYPLADFDYNIVTTDCRHFNVVFTNNSTVSNDGIHPVGTGEPCESSWWDFGNGMTSDLYSPTTHYDVSDTFNVTLVSSIGYGHCKDTITKAIIMPTFLNYDEYYAVCDSMTWWRDNTTYYNDTIGPLDLHPAPNGCDTAYALHLNVHHSVTNHLGTDTSCWSTPYSWHNHTFPDTNSILVTAHLIDSLYTTEVCDSVVTIDVVRIPKYDVSFDAGADCLIKQYHLQATSDAPYFYWSSSPPDPTLDGHTSDTVLTLSPEHFTTYNYHASYTSDFQCPTVSPITLMPVSFPTAELRVKPEYLTLDEMEYDAYDISHEDQERSWTLLEFVGGEPYAIVNPQPEEHIHRRPATIVDSVQVWLEVTNGFCHDTAHASIPMKYTSIYAPNIFTPDEATNNLFQIYAIGVAEVELDIYNREGLLIYHCNDLDHPWDGTREGRPCVQGAYVWRLRYISDDFPIRKQEKYGTIVLIR